MNLGNVNILHVASLFGHLSIVSYLMDNKYYDIDSVTCDGYTSLQMAASKGHGDIVKYLLSEKRANPNIITCSGESLLSCAAQSGKLEVVKYVVKNGADVLHRTKFKTILHSAAGSDSADVIAFVLTKIKILCGDISPYVNAPDNKGDTPLIGALKLGYINAISELMKYKPNLHCQNNAGETALHCAVNLGDVNIVQLLLDHGADATMTTRDDESCLNYALDLLQKTKDKVSYFEIINILKFAKNNVSQQNKNSKSPLHQAVIDDDIAMIKSLVDKKCDINAFDFYGRTALKLACEHGRLEIAKYLVEVSHTCCAIPTNDLRHLLIFSTECESWELVEYLVTILP